LKKIIIFALIFFGAWNYYQKAHKQNILESFKETKPDGVYIQKNQEAPIDSGSQFQCDGRQYCSQMTSREEAVYFIRNCPNTKMDGDNDGIPCENDSRF